jgi:hypothetical protein
MGLGFGKAAVMLKVVVVVLVEDTNEAKQE